MATFIVTKPGAAGAALAAALRAAGAQALLVPAFEIEPPVDLAAVRVQLSRLPDFDLAIFVSPAAVQATHDLLSGSWPAGTRIAAVGAGTAERVHDLLALPAGASVIAPAAPATEEASGSEALWPVLRALHPAPRRVLVLRAEQGREWLGERLRELGAEVDAAAVYRRSSRPWTAYAPATVLREALASGAIIVVTSSEAARVVRANLDAIDPTAAPRATAVTMHPRIAAALGEAGIGRVHALPVLDAAALLQLGR